MEVESTCDSTRHDRILKRCLKQINSGLGLLKGNYSQCSWLILPMPRVLGIAIYRLPDEIRSAT